MVFLTRSRHEEIERAQAQARANAMEQSTQAEIAQSLYNDAVSEAKIVGEENVLLKHERSRLSALADTLR